MPVKPILYHEVDGVLVAPLSLSQTKGFRPGIIEWLTFVHEHFSVVWLTTRPPREVFFILDTIWSKQFREYRMKNSPYINPECENWQPFNSKDDYLSANRAKLAGIQWFWIDDQIPSEKRLEQLCLEPWRCLRVNPIDRLVKIQGRLSQLLTKSS